MSHLVVLWRVGAVRSGDSQRLQNELMMSLFIPFREEGHAGSGGERWRGVRPLLHVS